MSRDRAAGTDQTRSQERSSYALPRGVHRFPEKEPGVCWIELYHNLHSFSIHQFTHSFVRLFIFILSPSTHPLLSQASRVLGCFRHGHAIVSWPCLSSAGPDPGLPQAKPTSLPYGEDTRKAVGIPRGGCTFRMAYLGGSHAEPQRDNESRMGEIGSM